MTSVFVRTKLSTMQCVIKKLKMSEINEEKKRVSSEREEVKSFQAISIKIIFTRLSL